MAVIIHPLGDVNGGWQLQYPIGKTLWQGENWISDVRVSPDGSKVAYFRHPPNIDDRGDVMVIEGGGKPRDALQRLGIAGWLGVEPIGKGYLVFSIGNRAAILHPRG